MTHIRVDLYSDTISQPTQAMRAAMAEAEVGDEQKREDPTVNQLVETVCEVAGKKVGIKHIDGPVGVQSRNFSNERIYSIGWQASPTRWQSQ